jgi:nucleoside-diphosphate-sugar epimerase
MNNKDIKNIVILAANGQVGLELCLYLRDFENISLKAIVRTEYSATILKRLNIECLVGDINKSEAVQEAIKKANLVFDLAAPSSGFVNEIKKFYQSRLSEIFIYMRKETSFVFASTQAAFGYKEPLHTALKYYFFPRSVYAANKRYAERICKKLGKRYGIDTYIFRLAEVHGVLQTSRAVIKDKIKKDYTFTINNTPANTIFIFEIAKALENITQQKELPGVYTMVSNHSWTWLEIIQYYAKEENKSLKINFIESQTNRFAKSFGSLKDFIFSFLFLRRDTLMANFTFLSHLLPSMQQKVIRDRIDRIVKEQNLNPEFTHLVRFTGVLPGKRMKSIPDIKAVIFDKEIFIQNELKNLL